MATRTIKTGDSVIIKGSDKKAVVKNIDRATGYQLEGSKLFYQASDLIAEKQKPEPKKRQPINQVSPQQKTLNAIYSIVSKDFLRHNRLCRARFAGCTHHATEVHHMYKRTGFWLIIMKFFFPICRRCHRYATKHSKEAIDAGVSLPRTVDRAYDFNKHERNLMEKYGVNPPA